MSLIASLNRLLHMFIAVQYHHVLRTKLETNDGAVILSPFVEYNGS